MASDDDVPDYMADLDLFVQSNDEKRVSSRSMKKRADSAAALSSTLPKRLRREERKKKQREEEVSGLQAGLAVPLDESNRGFKMLLKMGFTPGQAVGRSGHGRVEPVQVSLKQNKLGLGREDEEERAREERERRKKEQRERRERTEAERREEFGEGIRAKWRQKKLLRDFRKAMSLLEELLESTGAAQDAEIGADLPFREQCNRQRKPKTGHAHRGLHGSESFLVEDLDHAEENRGPPVIMRRNRDADEEEGEDDEAEEFVPTSKDLEKLLQVLRTKFLYCLYCGHKYLSLEELESTCPGLEEEVHEM